jgi:hypothetical protein
MSGDPDRSEVRLAELLAVYYTALEFLVTIGQKDER